MPWWNYKLKATVYYITLGYLTIFAVLIVFRYLLYLFCWTFGYSVWIFPRLNDDLGIIDSFKPVITIQKKKTNPYLRLAFIGVILALSSYVLTMPKDFSQFINDKKELINDIYSGRIIGLDEDEYYYNDYNYNDNYNYQNVYFIFINRIFIMMIMHYQIIIMQYKKIIMMKTIIKFHFSIKIYSIKYNK